MAAVPLTLSEKIWDAHVVNATAGEPDLLFIDLHLVHEVTSPQAFDGLRLAGRTVRRPGTETRSSSARPAGARPATGSRPASSTRWTADSAKSANGKRNDAHKSSASSNGARSN